MADIVVDPSQVSTIEVDSSEVTPAEKPWIGQPRPENESLLPYLFHLPAYGLQDIGTGVQHLLQSGMRRQGAHEVITGAGEMIGPPAIAGGTIASLPITGGAGLLPFLGTLGGTAVGGAAGGALGYGGASLAGASPETAQLMGDIGALAGGVVGAKAAPLIGAVAKGAAKGAQAGALRHYEKQGGITAGAVKGAVESVKGLRKPTPPPPPIDYTMGGSEMAIPGVGPRPPAPLSSVAVPEGWTGAPSARGPVAPVEPLKVGGPMPPPAEGTLPSPPPPAPLPPPPKLLPTAAERDAMAAGKMMEQRIAKDVKLAQYFKDQGLDATAVRKLSDAEFNTHLAANKMRAASKSPSGLHRSLDEIREHIASRLEGRPY